MRTFLFIAFLGVTTFVLAKEKSDSISLPWDFSGAVGLNSNGIAPVPSFALGEPAYSLSLSVKKNRFSYDPQISYSWDFKPWIIDNWFHYKIVDNPQFELRTGINVSMFFSKYKTPDETLWHGQRYNTLELAGIFKPTKTSWFGLMLWYDKGWDTGAVSGYFIDLVADKSDIAFGKHILMAINVQLFYIDYTDYNDGIFISPRITLSTRKHQAFSLFYQGIHPLITNIVPDPNFQWNIGIQYAF